MYGYIYLTTNLVNEKKYVGQHRSDGFDPTYYGSGKLLWRAISKYGNDNFKVEVIKFCESREELNQSEIDEIRDRDAVNSSEYYNIRSGGDGGNLCGEGNTFYGKKHTEESKRAISNSHKGVRRAKESKSKQLFTLNSRYGYESYSDLINSQKAKETKIKRYGSVTGSMMTPEVRARATEAMRESVSWIFVIDGVEIHSGRSLRDYIRENTGHKTCSYSTAMKIAKGGIPKGYEDLVGRVIIKRRNKKDENQVYNISTSS